MNVRKIARGFAAPGWSVCVKTGAGAGITVCLCCVLFAALAPLCSGCSASRGTPSAAEPVSPEEERTPSPAGPAEPGAADIPGTAPAPSTVPAFDPGKPLVIEMGNTSRKEVALTIDDGWNRDDRILDLLERYGIRCTVFVIGGRGVAEANPEWIRRMDRDGFEVCTHTYSHYKLTDHPVGWIVDDIRKGQDVIASVTGKRYPYMRPPGGFVNEAVRAAASQCGCHIVMWSNEFGDTSTEITVEGEVKAVLSRLRNGDIILCHFGGRNTYEALRRLIPEITNRGYRFVTLSELLSP